MKIHWEVLKEVVKEVPIDGLDALIVVSVVLIFFGLYQVYPPAAFVVSGGLLFYLAMLGVRK